MKIIDFPTAVRLARNILSSGIVQDIDLESRRILKQYRLLDRSYKIDKKAFKLINTPLECTPEEIEYFALAFPIFRQLNQYFKRPALTYTAIIEYLLETNTGNQRIAKQIAQAYVFTMTSISYPGILLS